MTRRPLGELLVEVGDAVALSPARRHDVRVTDLLMTLPLEISMRVGSDGLSVTGDVPRWRWRTVFDRDPGRLTLHMREEVPQ